MNEQRQRLNGWHLLIGFVVACFNATQSRVNGELGHVVGNGVLAALCSFSSGWVILLIIAVISRKVRIAFFSIPSMVRSGQLKWWQCIGGMAGATYVIGQGAVVPAVGVAVFTISVVAGQTTSSLLVDKYGLGPSGPKAITKIRVAAAVIAIIGVAIAKTGADHATAGHHNALVSTLPLVLYAFATGLVTAIQYALNGRVGVATGQPFATTLLNFTMGTLVLIVALLFMVFVQGVHLNAPPSPLDQPLLWTGGTIGIIFIASASVLVRSLGVLVFALLSVVGQLTGAIILDVFFPTKGTEVTSQIILGVVITAVAVTIASLPPKQIKG